MVIFLYNSDIFPTTVDEFKIFLFFLFLDRIYMNVLVTDDPIIDYLRI